VTTTLLAGQMGRIIHSAAAKLELGPAWHMAAAELIELHCLAGLRADAATVEVLRARHVQRPQQPGSTWSECAGCRLPFPCPDAIALGVAG
jgi:hypothetical protein